MASTSIGTKTALATAETADNNTLNGTGKQFTRSLVNTTSENQTAAEILASKEGPFDRNTTLASIIEQAIIEHIMAARSALDEGRITIALEEIVTALELHYELKSVNASAVVAGQQQPSIKLEQNPDGLQ